jgi:Zn-dependent protease with chaperone function
MRRDRALRLGATAVAAVIVAEAAVWALRPRDGTVTGPKAPESAYFTKQQVAEAHDFRGGQRNLMLATTALEAGLLVLLVSGRPAAVTGLLERAGKRPVLGAAAAGAGLSAGLAVVTLPLAYWAHERSVDVGLSTQDLGPWLADNAKSIGIGGAIAAGGAALGLGLIRRFGRRWWIPATGAVLVIEVVFAYLAPVVLAPAFNKFTPLEDGPLRSRVLELGRKADVDIGQVYKVDASRRSTALNAYVDGIGKTKRVVLYDNLIDDTGNAELESVVAHELGHVHGRDVPRGMLWVAIAAPLSMLFVAGATEALARRRGVDVRSPAVLPILALVLGTTVFIVGTVSNQLSRKVEARADTFALELTDDPQALIALQRDLTVRNVSDPDPPGWAEFLFGTHPSAVQRIGAAKAWEEGERP